MSAATSANSENGTLFELEAPAPSAPPARVVRVLLDQPAIAKQLDYAVPHKWITDGRSDRLEVGSMVRVPVSGRRVAAWITALDVEPPAGVQLKELAKLSGVGPSEDLLDLAAWAAWRWGGATASVLRVANPPNMVPRLGRQAPRAAVPPPDDPWVADAFVGSGSVVRLGTGTDVLPFALAGASLGNVLVLCPSLSVARNLGGRMRRAGVRVGLAGRDWSLGRAGASIVGGRAAAFAPVADLAAVIVLDEHDRVYQEERTPTWHSRDVAIERARRAGVPVVLLSPMLSIEALSSGLAVRSEERDVQHASWSQVDIVDRRDEPPGMGLWSEAFVDALHEGGTVAAILNRKGRSRLLACAKCGELAVCTECAGSMRQGEDDQLTCSVDGATRPLLCMECGSTRFKNLRVGVTRAREELEALARRRVVEVTADTEPHELTKATVMVGTEALLHRLDRADVVAFLDFDQSLVAGRYRAAEEALALIVRAARLVGPRERGGRVLVQTSQPSNPVLQAAAAARPEDLLAAETERRKMLLLPPFAAVAVVEGAAAAEYMQRFGTPPGVTIMGPIDDRWRLRAEDPAHLADAIAAVNRPPGRVRVAVDPLDM